MTRKVVLGILTGSVLLPFAAGAHTLASPDTVLANSDGTFSIDAVFTAGPGIAVIAAWSWYGAVNVGGGIVADCFCFPGCPLDEGETQTIRAQGSLTDPNVFGVVEFTVELCNGPSSLKETTILPYPATAVQQTTWSRLRQIYR